MSTAFHPDVPDADWSGGMTVTTTPTDNVPNRGPGLEAGSIAFLAIAISFVGLRLYTRITVVRGLGMDDYFALLALVLAAGTIGTVVVGTNVGIGKHIYDQTGESLIAALKVTYAFVIINSICLGALKGSVLSLYLKMTPSKSSKRVIFVVGTLVTMHVIAFTLTAVFQCKPVSAFWTLLDFESKCIRILDFDIINSFLETITDIVILILPIPIIRKLNMPKSKKRSLYILLGLGIITVICGFIKTAFLIVWVHSSDISWNFPLIPFLSAVQVCVGLAASSAPAIYPLFRKNPAEMSKQGFPVPKSGSSGSDKRSHSPTSHSSTLVQTELSRTASLEKGLVGIGNMKDVNDDSRQSWYTHCDVESLASSAAVSENLDYLDNNVASKDTFSSH